MVVPARPQGSSARRIWGLMFRHLALYRRSWPRVLELMYWPVLQMVVWGHHRPVSRGAGQHGFGRGRGAARRRPAVGGDALRNQMGFAISFLEEVWSRCNLGHLFVSPCDMGTGRRARGDERPPADCRGGVAGDGAGVLPVRLRGVDAGAVAGRLCVCADGDGLGSGARRHRVDPASWRGGGGRWPGA